VEKIAELTNQGVRKVVEMRRHLESFITNDLFKNRRPPSKTRRRFYPSNKDIANYMQRTRNSHRHSKIDQENLSVLIDNWRKDYPEDHFYFRPHLASAESEINYSLEDADDFDIDEAIKSEKNLVCYFAIRIATNNVF
jgi:hypothetical protein